MAAVHVSYLDADKVQRHAAGCVGLAYWCAVDLDAADADATIVGL